MYQIKQTAESGLFFVCVPDVYLSAITSTSQRCSSRGQYSLFSVDTSAVSYFEYLDHQPVIDDQSQYAVIPDSVSPISSLVTCQSFTIRSGVFTIHQILFDPGFEDLSPRTVQLPDLQYRLRRILDCEPTHFRSSSTPLHGRSSQAPFPTL